jgi:hypothetical protein
LYFNYYRICNYSEFGGHVRRQLVGFVGLQTCLVTPTHVVEKLKGLMLACSESLSVPTAQV